MSTSYGNALFLIRDTAADLEKAVEEIAKKYSSDRSFVEVRYGNIEVKDTTINFSQSHYSNFHSVIDLKTRIEAEPQEDETVLFPSIAKRNPDTVVFTDFPKLLNNGLHYQDLKALLSGYYGFNFLIGSTTSDYENNGNLSLTKVLFEQLKEKGEVGLIVDKNNEVTIIKENPERFN